jgi:CubicO group peptidase (beta-lactamase class C family)
MSEYCGDDFDRTTREHLLRTCMAAPLRFEPGAETGYSNPGYSVLAALVETVSGETLEAYLRTRLLRPNGLMSTGYTFDARESERLAHGYMNDADQGVISDRIAALEEDYWSLKGNGGMQASARDMLRWKQALAGAGRLSAEVRALLLTPPRRDVTEAQEGLGWVLQTDAAGELIRVSHSGSDGVFFSFFYWRPADEAFYYVVGSSGEAVSREAVQAAGRAMLRALNPTPPPG